MDIVIDLSSIDALLNLPADQMVFRLLVTFGWLPIAIIFVAGTFLLWMDYRQKLWGSKIGKVILAIDIPRNNIQSPKAVENLFTYLAGAHGTLNLIETYWDGAFQLGFSFEIVSINGYTQFLIRTPEKFRNLVETAVYSQYPDAEIYEVGDYTAGIPTNYPDEEYDVWGAEFVQKGNSMYPIKTYKEFEHQFGDAETTFRDPMASLMDLCSSLVDGEQLWFQILVKPEGFDWVKDGEKEIAKILKEKAKASKGIADYITDFLFFLLGGFAVSTAEEKKQDDSLKMMNLKPTEKQKVEAISAKISQLGFKCKLRMVYVARKEVMNKPKVVNGFVGWIKQFINLNLNNLKPDMDMTATSASYFFKNYRMNERKRKIVKNYIGRDGTAGRKMGLYTIDELATLWHFPVEAVVKAPLVQKTSGRKVEAPMTLPLGDSITKEQEFFASDFQEMISGNETAPRPDTNIFVDEKSDFMNEIVGKQETQPPKQPETKEAKPQGPPENLPFV